MTLTATRKADRIKMAEALATAMREAGAASVEVDHAWSLISPRESMIRIIAPGGAYINATIDGDLPDIIGGTWNTPARVWLNPALGDVNPFHFGKLNRFFGTVDDCAFVLGRDVRRFADGSGYLPETDPRITAMRVRYRANGWQWHGEPA